MLIQSKRTHDPKVGRTDETQYITEEYVAELEAEMFAAAEALEFERAATIRDRIGRMREQIAKPVGVVGDEESQSRPSAMSSRPNGKSQTGRGGRRGKKTGDPAAWKGRVPRPKKSV